MSDTGPAFSRMTLTIGVIIPAFQSFKALKTPGDEDDKQLLTYFICLAAYMIAEVLLDPFFSWVPMWMIIKLIVLVWLSAFKGAMLVYRKWLAPWLDRYEGDIENLPKNVALGFFSIIKQFIASRATDIKKAISTVGTMNKSDIIEAADKVVDNAQASVEQQDEVEASSNEVADTTQE